MRLGWRAISGALATLLGLTGLLLLLMLVLLRPPVGDLTAMAGFLLASGGLTARGRPWCYPLAPAQLDRLVTG